MNRVVKSSGEFKPTVASGAGQRMTAAPPLSRARVVVVGARGYSGAELVRLLLGHPGVEIAGLFATQKFTVREILPEWTRADVAGLPEGDSIEALKLKLDEAGGAGVVPFDYALLATPAEVSMELAPLLLARGVRVIDISGAFRLKGTGVENSRELYRRWYGFEHGAAEWVQRADYGLIPFGRGEPTSTLVANPGCFATAVALSLIPLYADGLVEPATVAVDAKSGTTGAGKKPEERLLHAEVDGACLPYRVGRHQHEPEIAEAIARFSWKDQSRVKDVSFSFVPHLLSVRRGIIVSVHARLRAGVTGEKVARAFSDAYGEYPLMRVVSLLDKGSDTELSLRRVVGSARSVLAWHVRRDEGSGLGDQLYVFCLIDNLLKGAASQAVENLNRFLGLPLETGLLEREGVL